MSKIARLPRPERLRLLEKPFAPIPCRLITDGIFAHLSDPAKLLYLFLCIVADRQGISYYSDARIRTFFQLDPEQIVLARHELIEQDLIGYDGHLYQVLSLPSSCRYLSRCSKPSLSSAKASEPELVSDILKRLVK